METSNHSIFRKKSLHVHQQDDAGAHGHPHGGTSMRKILGVRDLTLMGVAAVIGAGIFSTIGSAAFHGGPGVIFLFVITAITCGFCALCYAEFASRIPVSGSAYTYSYVSFGEVIAWVIGWALILEYAIGNIVVAISWSAYFNNILKAFGIHLPDWLTVGYQTAKAQFDTAIAEGKSINALTYSAAPEIMGFKFIINLPGFIIVALVTLLAYVGIQESKRSANFMVILKIVVLGIVALIGIWYIFSEQTMENWTPFMPNGITGVLKGVSAVFFAYIGFDAISTTAEECANPRRDMPRAMIYSLLICTVIYVVIALVITGMVNYKEFDGIADPLAYVFDKINMQKIGFFISVSAVVAATSVLLVFQIGQPRIWMAMSRDGLLPPAFGKINQRFRTPGFATIITGILVGGLALFVDDKIITDLTSIGTLFAFALVSGGVLLLPARKKEEGKFQLPYINGKWIMPLLFAMLLVLTFERIRLAILDIRSETHQEILFLLFVLSAGFLTVRTFLKKYSLIPILGVLCCLYLMIEIPVKSWLVFFGWMGLGLLIYFLYGYRKSTLARKTGS